MAKFTKILGFRKLKKESLHDTKLLMALLFSVAKVGKTFKGNKVSEIVRMALKPFAVSNR